MSPRQVIDGCFGRMVTTAAALSLVLCVVTAYLGVRSSYRKDKLEYVSTGGWLILAISSNARLDILYDGRWTGDPGFTHIRGSPSGIGATDYGRRFMGMGAGVTGRGGRFVNIPYWLIVSLCAIPPVLRLRRARRRRPIGVCRICGYDVRATPGRCPECGTVNPQGVTTGQPAGA